MPYSTYLKNRLLNCLRNNSGAIAAVYASLHTASPGDNGANEVAGGAPAYARKQMTWNAPAGGTMDGDSVTFDVPAGTTVTHVGFWDAAAAGNFLGYADVTDEAFVGQGTYTLTDADLDLNS